MAVSAIVASTVVSVGATVSSMQSQKKAAREQRRAAELQRQRDRAAQQRQRAAAIRETRLAAARASQAAANQGVAGSSGAQGGGGSIISQGTANISFLDQGIRVGDQISERLGRAAQYRQRAQTAQGIGQLSNQVMGVFPNATADLTSRIESFFGRGTS